MLESAEIGHRISKEEYAREEPKLREALLNAQWDLSRSGHGPVLLIISGVEAGGRGETANKLTEWMDPRHIRVVAFGPRSGDELVRPLPWRYWRALPPKGRDRHLHERLVQRGARRAGFRGKIDDGASRAAARVDSPPRADARRRRARAAQVLGPPVEKGPEATARAAREGSAHALARHAPRLGCVAALQQVARHCGSSCLRESSTGEAPWYVVEGTDDRYRNLTVGTILLDAMRRTIAAKDPPATARDHAARAVRDRQRQADPRARPVEDAARQAIPARSREVPGQARAAHAAQALRRAVADPRVRRRRRRGQGRRHSPRHRGARRAAIRDRAGRRAHRRRARAPVPVAILAAGAAVRRHHDLRPLVVRPRAGRARRGLLHRRRLDARLRRDQPVRGAADRRRRRRSSSSGCRSARQSSCDGSARARRSRSSTSRSRPTTGATARSGTPTNRPSATWSIARARRSRRGRWSRPRTRTTRGSRYSRRSSSVWRPRLT